MLQLPKAFKFLTGNQRAKVIYGGRGGGKSMAVATWLLLEGAQEKHLVLCAREFQRSIKDSVHAVLKQIIESDQALSAFYTIQNNEIIGLNGTKFIFHGIRHNIANIKSIPNITRCWVEEAETVSDESWNVLTPTIRGEKSQIIITFNPDISDSPTYQRWVVSPPSYAIVKKINYDQNPLFPTVLEIERKECEVNNPDLYSNIWLGEPRATVAGAVFHKELTKAEQEGRITEVAYNPTQPVSVFFDLGRSDKTAIWFVQNRGLNYAFINYYENSGHHFSHYIKYLKELPYQYKTIYLPHDGAHETVAAEKSIEAQCRQSFSSVVVVPRVSQKIIAIDAARSLIDMSYFDAKNCAVGINCLRRYAYDVKPNGYVSIEPKHDQHSHGADALQQVALGMKPVTTQHYSPKRKTIIRRSGSNY